jgi:ADP-ribosylglycohydrolase
MAKLVFEVLIQARQNQLTLEQAMEMLANEFIHDMHDSIYGWAAAYRAPGNACLQGVKELERCIDNGISKQQSYWWRTGKTSAGGCGSVMRAYPFGLIFADDPAKARLWAVEHSRLTPSNPIALAACAAYAEGIVWVTHSKEPEFIAQKMIDAAHIYDKNTATKMKQVQEYAHQAQTLLAKHPTVYQAMKYPEFRAYHNKVFSAFEGWAADDAIAGALYIFMLVPHDPMAAIFLGVHTPGDSDSIASMVGALVGAYKGIEFLPHRLVNRVEDATLFRKFAQQVASLSQNQL